MSDDIKPYADTPSLMTDLKKKFGTSCICRLGDSEKMMDIKVRSSGSLQLDLALGGGYGHGRIVELSGVEKAGKTTLANLAIAEAQLVEPDKENAVNLLPPLMVM